jgi:hypothetical protein
MISTSIRLTLALGLPPGGKLTPAAPSTDAGGGSAGGCKWHGPHDEGACPRCERMRELRAQAPTQVRSEDTGSLWAWRAAGSGTGA